MLGLLPADASLKDLDVQLLSSQVAGLYDPDTKTMDVVSKSGQLGPVEQITYAHEFDHALQDQNFGLDKLGLDDTSDSDRTLARLSLPEGDATLLMTPVGGGPPDARPSSSSSPARPTTRARRRSSRRCPTTSRRPSSSRTSRA